MLATLLLSLLVSSGTGAPQGNATLGVDASDGAPGVPSPPRPPFTDAAAAEAAPTARFENTSIFSSPHKMGTQMLRAMQKTFYSSRRTQFKYRVPSTTREQTVVVTRDVTESIVSGYLYHKKGYECWVDEYGRPHPKRNANDWLLRFKWQKHVRLVDFTNASSVERSLCHVLRDTEESLGVIIYAEFALRMFIQSAAELRNKGRSVPALWFCYEEIRADPLAALQKIDDFLSFKGRDYDAALARSAIAHNGSHSTTRDPTLRRRLSEVVRNADDTWLGGHLARASKVLGCEDPVRPNLMGDLKIR